MTRDIAINVVLHGGIARLWKDLRGGLCHQRVSFVSFVTTAKLLLLLDHFVLFQYCLTSSIYFNNTGMIGMIRMAMEEGNVAEQQQV